MVIEMEADKNRLSEIVQRIGHFLLRYGLVLVLGWIGAMKFTAYEAEGIQSWSPPVH
jgi:uncharacterized membrane protein YkgB